MTFDEGNNGFGLDYEIRARFQAAIELEGVSWPDLIRRARVDPAKAQRAFDQLPEGLQANFPVFGALANVLGRDLNWVVTGSADAETRFRESLKERVVRITWEYIYKAHVPKEQRSPLVKEVRRVVDSLRCSTAQTAYRSGVPRTWKDVAWIHDRVVKGGSV